MVFNVSVNILLGYLKVELRVYQYLPTLTLFFNCLITQSTTMRYFQKVDLALH